MSILTSAEIEEIERLDAARTQGEWEGNRWGTVRSQHYVIVAPGNDNNSANAAFIAACSNAVPKMLATIRTLRDLLAEATDWDHSAGCSGNLDAKYPCKCGYRRWLEKVLEILGGDDA